MGTEKKNGRMVPTMKESFARERNTDRELIFGAMEVPTLVDGYSTISMALANISGQMAAATKAHGRITSSMDAELTCGQMGEGTKENI